MRWCAACVFQFWPSQKKSRNQEPTKKPTKSHQRSQPSTRTSSFLDMVTENVPTPSSQPTAQTKSEATRITKTRLRPWRAPNIQPRTNCQPKSANWTFSFSLTWSRKSRARPSNQPRAQRTEPRSYQTKCQKKTQIVSRSAPNTIRSQEQTHVLVHDVILNHHKSWTKNVHEVINTCLLVMIWLCMLRLVFFCWL